MGGFTGVSSVGGAKVSLVDGVRNYKVVHQCHTSVGVATEIPHFF